MAALSPDGQETMHRGDCEMPSWYRIDSKRVLLSCLYLPFQGDGEEARACSTASAGCPAQLTCIASRTSAPTPGECGRPRTVTRATSRQISGSTSARATTPG